MLFWLGIVSLALGGPAYDDPLTPVYEGPDTVEVDLLRTTEGGDRVFVQAILPDGEPGLFMLDTGAATSALSRETAERLGLPVDRNWGTLEGLGGSTPFHRAELPTLTLGEATVHDIEVAVGVRGVPETAGAMPLDGIIGNNVLQHWVVEIDYPADLLVLHRYGTFHMPRHAAPMLFENGHVLSTLEMQTETHTGTVFTQIDTGASGLVLSGATGAGFEEDATEGLEPVYGIGASEILPPSVFLQRTRRIRVRESRLGGRKVKQSVDARWLNFSEGSEKIGPQGMRGLVGHDMMADHRVLFDYSGQAFALTRSHHKARQLNGHARLLEQDVARYGDDPARYLFRARLHVWMDEPEAAIDLLEAYLEHHPSDAEARVLLGGMRRIEGDLEGSWEALSTLTPTELVEEHEIVAVVNGLILEGRPDDALAVADEALESLAAADADLAGDSTLHALFRNEDDIEHRRTWSWARVARADALLALGRTDKANDALLDAASMVENPDAHLLRRSRVALARDDLYGAQAHVRRLLQLYPSAGQFLWSYALLVGPDDRATFRADMEEALAQLHPSQRPLDFMVAAYTVMGDEDAAREALEEGLARDCDALHHDASRDNCVAWYSALAQRNLDEALRLSHRALEAEGDRSDFLDTLAVVHLTRGELDEAHDAALRAARLSPEDAYLLWQAERIGQLADQAEHSP